MHYNIVELLNIVLHAIDPFESIAFLICHEKIIREKEFDRL